MIDIFPQIYTELSAKLKEFSKSAEGLTLLGGSEIKVSDTHLKTSQYFPCVTIEEKNNSNAEGETDLVEKRSAVMYEINVYDNSPTKMEKCRKLAKVIDGYLSGIIGFERSMSQPFPNEADSTIYRYLMRYEGYVDNETGNVSRKLS